MAQKGQLIGERYRLESVLGGGGVGAVWLGHDAMRGRPVTVKEVLLPAGVDEQERQELYRRTMRVGRVTAGLNHPGVVTVYDVVSDEGRPYIVMESVQGHSLAEEIDRSGALPPQRVATIGLSLLGALRAAHRAGIVHGEVKPSNVLLAADGRIVLTDFGVATSEQAPTATSSGLIIGSPAYMSPERMRGESVGPAADFWGLGATLYAALEAGPPFHAGTAAETITAVLTDEVSPPLVRGPLREAVLGMLVKDPQQRLGQAQIRELLLKVTPGPRSERSMERRSVSRPVVERAVAQRPVVEPSGDERQVERPAEREAGVESESSGSVEPHVPVPRTAPDEAPAPATTQSGAGWWDPSGGDSAGAPRKRSVLPAAVLAVLVVLGAVTIFFASTLDVGDDPAATTQVGAEDGAEGGPDDPAGAPSDDPAGTPTPAPFDSPELLSFTRGLFDASECGEPERGFPALTQNADLEAVHCEGSVYSATLFRKSSLAELREERNLYRGLSVPGRVSRIAKLPTDADDLVDGRRFFFVPPDGRLRLYWDSVSCLCGGVITAQDIDPRAAGQFWRGDVPKPFESRDLFEFTRGLFAPMDCVQPAPGERPLLDANPDAEAVYCDGPTYDGDFFLKATAADLDEERQLHLNEAEPASVEEVPEPPAEVLGQGAGRSFLYTAADGNVRLYWDSVECGCGGVLEALDDDATSIAGFWRND